MKETSDNFKDARSTLNSVSGKTKGDVAEVEDSGTSTEEDKEAIEEIDITRGRAQAPGNYRDRKSIKSPETSLSPNSRMKYSSAVLRNKRRDAADGPTETSLSPDSRRNVRDRDDIEIDDINAVGYVTERGDGRKQRREINPTSRLNLSPQRPLAPREKEDQDNRWRRERECGESEERASTFVIPVTRIRQGAKGASLVSDTLKRVRNKVNGSGQASSSSGGHINSKSSRDNDMTDELYGDDEDHVSRNTRGKKRLAMPSHIDSDESKHALALEQQNLHKQYLESSSNSPGKGGKSSSFPFKDTPDHGQTTRLIRPLNFSHPVLRSDCDGDFFDRDDLRHSDSRNYSHSHNDVSRTNIADVNKVVTNIISNRSGWNTAKKRTVER